MAMKPPQWTTDQKLVITALLSILGSAVIAGISAIALNASKAPEAINIGVSLSVFATAFMASLGPALYHYLPTHWQEIIRAQQDTIAQLTATSTVPPLPSAPIAISTRTVTVTGGATVAASPIQPSEQADTSGDTTPRMQAVTPGQDVV